jgi:23S rRNA pseudouridine1911/1915/1917 synthase
MDKFEVQEPNRLDKALSLELDVSRNQVEKLIKESLVKVNDKIITKTSYKVAIGDKIEYEFKEATAKESIDVDFDVEVLYEDEYLLIVNKPSGLVVHPAPSVKEATLVDWLIKRGISLSTISGEERHGIVHRIDKETTGALVIAKDNQTHQKLSLQLQDKSMGRYYLALIDLPLKDDVIVDKPIARNPKNRLKMDIIPDGRDAKSAFVKLLTSPQNIELISAKLYTGRTHQIRVHLKSLSRHILGDDLYGYKPKKVTIPRVFLHAYMLYLIHPATGKKLEVVAPLFDDMLEFCHTSFSKDELSCVLDATYIKNRFKSIS